MSQFELLAPTSLSSQHFFASLGVTELWIHYGVRKHIRLIPILLLSAAIGPRKCAVLPTFHALTSCDTVSCLHGKGKSQSGQHGIHILNLLRLF